MGLLLFPGLLMRMCIGDDSDALDGAEPTKFLFQVSLVGIIAQTSYNKRLKGVAADIWVFVRLEKLGRIRNLLFCSVLLLLPLAIALLQPALSRVVAVCLLVLLELWEKGRDSGDGRSLAVLGRMIRGVDPSQGWTRREERKQVGGKLVGHGAAPCRVLWKN